MKPIFEYKSYKPYLRACMGPAGRRTGRRAALAKHLNCQTAYISQVISKQAHLSLEQAFKTNPFLKHTPDESDYFLLLVQKDRAGTMELKNHFKQKMEQILQKRLVIKNRVDSKNTLSPIDQSTYYSMWHYSAVHVILSIPELQTKQAISNHLGLPLSTVNKCLDFLVNTGIATTQGDRFIINPINTFLGNDSENIVKHHSNWRTQALRSLDRETNSDLHYSTVMTMSQKTALVVKDRLIETINQTLKEIGPSKEEVIYGHTIDFFNLKNS